jgi:hypothetical protein
MVAIAPLSRTLYFTDEDSRGKPTKKKHYNAYLQVTNNEQMYGFCPYKFRQQPSQYLGKEWKIKGIRKNNLRVCQSARCLGKISKSPELK